MSFQPNHLPYRMHVPPLLRPNGFYPALYPDVQFLQMSGNVPQPQQQAFVGLLNNQSASTPLNSNSVDAPSLLKGGLQGSGFSPLATTASPTTVVDLSSPMSSSRSEEESAAGRLDLRRQLCNQNVFVFHLPPDWGEEMLRRVFASFGEIMSVKVVQRPDGSSKGYGFVCFSDSSAAKQAVEAMNDFCVAGKRLKVSLKKTPEECMSMEVEKLITMSENGGSFDPDQDCTLFVFHLPPYWTDNDIYERFKEFGDLISATVARKSDRSSRGYGFAKFGSPRAAAMAIRRLNGADVGSNKRLKVQLKQQTQQHHKPGCTVFVFHIPSDWTDATFRQHFTHYGKVVNVTIQRDAQGKNRGFGFISFDKPQSALAAINGMNGFSVGQKRLKVAWKDGEERYFTQYSSSAHLSELVYGQQQASDSETQVIGADARTPTAGVHHPGLPSPLSGYSPTAAGSWLPSPVDVSLAAQLSAYQSMAAAGMNPSAAATAYGMAPTLPEYGNFTAMSATPWNTLHAIHIQKALQEQQQREASFAMMDQAQGTGKQAGARNGRK
eukprot:GHVN01056388.1.p1 GENE.GHVN01056388.1~~GHVN01056388.1.p1  ORF type:complete len:551 (+),score=58.08 GHVN01056388.1:201-1853(+)